MEYITNPFKKFHNEWALVTCGKENDFNSMTISWGEMGTIWNKDVITIFVRPERFTSKFLAENDTFSVSFYDSKYKDKLKMFGTKSGRDTDKVKESGFHPVFINNTPSYKEASETFILKKIYLSELDKSKIPSDSLFFYDNYEGLAHYIIIGEIIDYKTNKEE